MHMQLCMEWQVNMHSLFLICTVYKNMVLTCLSFFLIPSRFEAVFLYMAFDFLFQIWVLLLKLGHYKPYLSAQENILPILEKPH